MACSPKDDPALIIQFRTGSVQFQGELGFRLHEVDMSDKRDIRKDRIFTDADLAA